MNGTPHTETLHSGPIPLGRLDAVLAAAHMIPRQNDVPNLLRMVKYCSLPPMLFQRLCVIIETPLRERDRLYSFDVETNSSTCSRMDMMTEEGRYALFRQTDARMMTGDELFKEFPATTRLDVFRNARQCLLQPLPVNVNGYSAALLFIWTGEAPENDALTLSRVLGGIVAGTLTQILQTAEQNMAIESYRQERDHLNILVGIANVANSTLHLDSLLDMVSMDLYRFFQVSHVALMLHEQDGAASLYGTCPGRHRTSGIPRGSIVPLETSLLRYFKQGEAFRLLRENALQNVRKTDPLAAYFLAHGDKVVCGFPLVFRQTCLGALVLAHAHADVFTRGVTSLLSQIAVFVASAVHNAREYAIVNAEKQRLAAENATLSAKISLQLGDGSIIGRSAAIRHVLHQIEMVGDSDSNVLLLGETGTGKELMAEAIHKRSRRKARPMVKFNCAAVPAGLLESELFGHEKGAFTGATSQTKGRFELAQGGTLLLDEVGDMPLELQPKLLRILQSRELERLGGQTVVPVDVRLVAATNRNLVEMVRQGSFREDLYYRLNVFPIHIPPLRERKDDIPLLAQHFMEQISRRMKKQVTRISATGLRWLCDQEWPGNVRELANVIERAVICSTGSVLDIEDAMTQLGSVAVPQGKPRTPSADKVAAHADDAQDIIDAVRACNGLIAGPRGAAARLGVNRTTLNSRMKKMGLDVRKILEG